MQKSFQFIFIFFYKFTKIKIKSFECPKSIRNYKKIMLGTSDAWSTTHMSHRTSEPAYYIVDCQISRLDLWLKKMWFLLLCNHIGNIFLPTFGCFLELINQNYNATIESDDKDVSSVSLMQYPQRDNTTLAYPRDHSAHSNISFRI